VTINHHPDETVLPLAEETVSVERRLVETGRVRVSLRTEVEQREVAETLHSESVEVEHVPVNPHPRRGGGGAAAPPRRRWRWIIPVVEEVLVVERRLVLREELHLHVRRTAEHFRQTVPLRRQEVAIDATPGDPGPGLINP
jgi:stress response protein YsnF